MDPNPTDPQYNHPTKVTCKVVKRAGQRGARIYPKGYKIRTEVDRDGNIVNRFTDTGLKKITIKPQRAEYVMKLSNFNNSFAPGYWERWNDVDETEWLFCFRNGVFDLRTMAFRDAQPKEYIRYHTSYDFEMPREGEVEKVLTIMMDFFAGDDQT